MYSKEIRIKWNITRIGLSILSSKRDIRIFYHESVFLFDFDLNSNIYKLNSCVDHMTRSKVLYHPSVISSERNVIKKSNKSKKGAKDK